MEGGVGRVAITPEILLSLWLYATLDGVDSGREVSRLTQAHDTYRWLCVGMQANHHTLSDFRKDHGEALDELLSVSIDDREAGNSKAVEPVADEPVSKALRSRPASRLGIQSYNPAGR